MTALPTGRAGQALAAGLLVLALAAMWLGVAAPALDWYAARSATLANRQALAARMAALIAAAPALQAAAQPADPAHALLAGATDAIAEAALQQLVQDMTAQAGASLTSAEALPAAVAGGYRRLGLRVSVNGPWPVLVALFSAIERGSPRMLIDDLQLQPGLLLTPGARMPLDASFTVLAFHSGGPR